MTNRKPRQKAGKFPAISTADLSHADSAGDPASRRILFAVFALSGMAGLIYETAWTRYLQLFLGHAAYAQVLVIALFMGGMGAGALLAGRLSSTRAVPLLMYGSIEAGLGLAALIFHWVFDGATGIAYQSILPLAQDSAIAEAMQWLLAAALIVPQSVLLGMTFPLMSASVLRLGGRHGAGGAFAMLYFTNSAGAVIGVLLAGFWLIEAYGLQATMSIAGCANLAVAAVAFRIARRNAGSAPAAIRPPSGTRIGRWFLLFAFLTAVSSFLYEIAWLRMLALVQGSSTHAFETMLSAFILGIALGGLWVRGRIDRFRSPIAALASIQILMGLAAVATLPAYSSMFDVMQFALEKLPTNGVGYFGYNFVGYLISTAIMVPASFFAGTTLPLLTFVLYQRGRGESEIGAVYGWNALGSIAGVALGGLLLLPLLGLKNLVVAGAALDMALGFALLVWLLRARERLRFPRATIALAAGATAALLIALTGFEFDVTRVVSGVFRTGRSHLDSSSRVIHYADGRTATVSVVDYPDGTRSIATNGKIDAGIVMNRQSPRSDEYTMVLLGALPLAHAPQARRAAIIGFGSGLTTHVVLASPAIEQVDVIEIEPEMVKAAREFLPRVARAYDDPRSRIHIEDARAWFARSGQLYDFIVSEPSNPWISGVASLFTPQFYRQASRTLAPGGLFIQWFHLYEIDIPQVASIVSGLGSVFSDYVLYAANDNDAILVATTAGRVPPLSDVLFGWPPMRRELAELDIRTPAQLNLFRMANRQGYGPLLEDGKANTDYFPILEYGAARSRFLNIHVGGLNQLVRDAVPVLEILSGLPGPEAVQDSVTIAGQHPRFADVVRANAFAAALAGGGSNRQPPLGNADKKSFERVMDLQANGTEAAWDDWFEALLRVSKPMIPNGRAPALASFINSAQTAAQLRRAPAEVRDKVEFLMRVGARDVAGIRSEGTRLLAGSLEVKDPIFYFYTLVATVAACLTTPRQDGCPETISRLDSVREDFLIIDLLRAHRRALR